MGLFTICKEFRFEAAHKLPHHDGKCARLHGHSYVGRVYFAATSLIHEGAKVGMVADYGDIKALLAPIVDGYLDHHYLNETLCAENPTAEVIASWIYFKLHEAMCTPEGREHIPPTVVLVAVEIDETCTSSARFSRSSALLPK